MFVGLSYGTGTGILKGSDGLYVISREGEVEIQNGDTQDKVDTFNLKKAEPEDVRLFIDRGKEWGLAGLKEGAEFAAIPIGTIFDSKWKALRDVAVAYTKYQILYYAAMAGHMPPPVSGENPYLHKMWRYEKQLEYYKEPNSNLLLTK